jgi:hypothetical protein
MHTDGQCTPDLVCWPIHVRGHAWWWIQLLACLLARSMEALRTWLALHVTALHDAPLTPDEINRSSPVVMLRWVKFWKQIQAPHAVADETDRSSLLTVLKLLHTSRKPVRCYGGTVNIKWHLVICLNLHPNQTICMDASMIFLLIP